MTVVPWQGLSVSWPTQKTSGIKPGVRGTIDSTNFYMRLTFRQEGSRDRVLESQETCPRIGEYVVVADYGESIHLRGKVVHVEWALESKCQARALVILLLLPVL